MSYKKALLIISCGALLSLSADDIPKSGSSSEQSQIASLDSQIKKLKDERDMANMRAYEAKNTADQVMEGDWLGYKQALARQKQFQEEASALDTKIADLEKRKQALQTKG
ncbi:MAG: hypothetical protein JSR46_01575 [Verrucomicrobia bacterium]|nr:hypothetical protein [Verrucomicrobiota bacterium]